MFCFLPCFRRLAWFNRCPQQIAVELRDQPSFVRIQGKASEGYGCAQQVSAGGRLLCRMRRFSYTTDLFYARKFNTRTRDVILLFSLILQYSTKCVTARRNYPLLVALFYV